MSLRSEVRDSANVKPNMLAKHENYKIIRVSKNVPRKQNAFRPHHFNILFPKLSLNFS